LRPTVRMIFLGEFFFFSKNQTGNILSAALAAKDEKAINGLVAHLVEEATHIVVSRQLLSEVSCSWR
jgi:hypothetical protein